MKPQSSKGVIFVGKTFWDILRKQFEPLAERFCWSHPSLREVKYLKYYDFFVHGRDEVYTSMCAHLGYKEDGSKGEVGTDYKLSAPYVLVFLCEESIPKDVQECARMITSILTPMREENHTCYTKRQFILDPKNILPTISGIESLFIKDHEIYKSRVKLHKVGGVWIEAAEEMFGLSTYPESWGTVRRKRIGLIFFSPLNHLQLLTLLIEGFKKQNLVTQTVRSQTHFYLLLWNEMEYVIPFCNNGSIVEYSWNKMKEDLSLRCDQLFYIHLESKEVLEESGSKWGDDYDGPLEPQLITTLEDWIKKVKLTHGATLTLMSRYFDNYNQGKDHDHLFDGIPELIKTNVHEHQT